MGGRLDSQLLRLIPVDVDEQAGVRGAWRHHDRTQMPLNFTMSANLFLILSPSFRKLINYLHRHLLFILS